jgi:mannosyltransferase
MRSADANPRFPVATSATWWVTVAIVALNLALKLPRLGEQSLWLDEALTVSHAGRSLSAIVTQATGNQNPPLYGVVMAGWFAVFGTSETSARALPMLCSTAAAVAVFALGRRFLGGRAALLAALVFTFSEIHVQYAREARVYALVSLLAILASHAYLALMARPRRRTAVALTVLDALLFHAHYVTVFVPLAQLVAMLAHRPWRERAGRLLVGSLGATALLCLPLVPLAWRNAPTVGGFWLGPPTFGDLGDLLKRFAGKRPAVYVALVAALPPIRRLLAIPAGALDRGVLLYLACWAFLPIALAFLVASRMPIFLDRYLLFAAPAVAALIAYLATAVPMRQATYAALVAGVVLSLAPKARREHRKDDWRQVVAVVRELQAGRVPGSSVVLVPAGEIAAFAYYWDRALLGRPDMRERLAAADVVAANDLEELGAARIAALRSVLVVRTRDAEPHVAGFAPLARRVKVQGLELLAAERR